MTKIKSALGTVLLILFGLSSLHGGMAAPLFPDVRESNSRPFWLEKTVFTNEDFLYAVGIASHKATLEEANRLAFFNGVTELQTALQITDLKDTGMLLSSPESYAETNADGNITVYRLVSLSLRDWDKYKAEKRLLEGVDTKLAKAHRELAQQRIVAMLDQERREREQARKDSNMKFMAEMEKLREKREQELIAHEKWRKESDAYFEQREKDNNITLSKYCPKLRIGMTRSEADRLLGHSEVGERPGGRAYQRGIITLYFHEKKLLSIDAPYGDRCLALSVDAKEKEDDEKEQSIKREELRRKHIAELEGKAWSQVTSGRLSSANDCFVANMDLDSTTKSSRGKRDQDDCDAIAREVFNRTRDTKTTSQNGLKTLPPDIRKTLVEAQTQCAIESNLGMSLEDQPIHCEMFWHEGDVEQAKVKVKAAQFINDSFTRCISGMRSNPESQRYNNVQRCREHRAYTHRAYVKEGLEAYTKDLKRTLRWEAILQ